MRPLGRAPARAGTWGPFVLSVRAPSASPHPRRGPVAAAGGEKDQNLSRAAAIRVAAVLMVSGKC